MKILSIFLLLNLVSFARIDSWSTHVNTSDTRDIQIVDENIWCATNGGLLIFDPKTQTYQKKFIEHGLSGLSIADMEYFDQTLWVCYENSGTIDVLNQNAEVIHSYPFEVDGFDRIEQHGDSLWVVFLEETAGLVLFSRIDDEWKFRDTFRNLSADSVISEVHDLKIFDNQILVATSQGLFFANLKGTNLKDPAQWQHFDYFSVYSIAEFENQFFFATSNGLLSGNSIESAEQIDSLIYSDLIVEEDLYLVSSQKMLLWNADTLETIVRLPYETQSVSVDGDSVWIGTKRGLRLWNGWRYYNFHANSPMNSFFQRATVTESGELWMAGKKGIAIQSNDGIWRNIHFAYSGNSGHEESGFYQADTIAFPSESANIFRYSRDIKDIIEAPDGSMLVSYWGSGVLRIISEFPLEYEIYNEKNYLRGLGINPKYVVSTEMVADSEKVWICNPYADSCLVSVNLTTNEWNYFSIHDFGSALDKFPMTIDIGLYGNLWIGSVDDNLEHGADGGVRWFHPIQNEWNMLSELQQMDVKSLRMDSEGYLWAVTDEGVYRFWFNGADFALGEFMSSLRYLYVSRVEVDNRNNRWFITDEGIHAFLQNWTWINGGEGYNVSNSDLLSNDVADIAFRDGTGETIFVTSDGASILQTPFASSKMDLSNLKIYPQPFDPKNDSPLIIEGLTDEADVKILNLEGRLIAELTRENGLARGHEANWNGKDRFGKIVQTGVYLVFAYDGENRVTEKIMVLRR